MMDLLKVLVYEMNTVDGKRGSAKPILELLEQERQKPCSQLQSDLYRKVMLKYLVLRVRAKISYEAFARKMTVSELFLNEIMRTSDRIAKTRAVPNQVWYPCSTSNKFDEMIKEGLPQMFKTLMQFNKCVYLLKRKYQHDPERLK